MTEESETEQDNGTFGIFAIRKDANGKDLNSQFPYRLFRLLNDAEKKKFDDVICWAPSGKSFQILDRDRFEKDVMPLYFTSTQFKSFQRSLNLWQFLKIRDGQKESGNIGNRFFVRDQPELCHKMTRVKNKGLYRRVRNMPPAEAPTTAATNASSVAVSDDGSSITAKNSPITKPVPSKAGTNKYENANKILLGIQLPGSPLSNLRGLQQPPLSASAFSHQPVPPAFLADALGSTAGNTPSFDMLQKFQAMSAPPVHAAMANNSMAETMARLSSLQERERQLQQMALLEYHNQTNSALAREQDALAGLASLAAAAPPSAWSAARAPSAAAAASFTDTLQHIAATERMRNPSFMATAHNRHQAELRRAMLQSLFPL